MRLTAVGLLGLLIFAGTGCFSEALEPIRRERCGPAVAHAEDDVREVVLRALIRDHNFLARRRPSVYFLGVEGSFALDKALGWNPSPQLLQRFAGTDPPVRPISEWAFSGNHLVADPVTGREAILFSVPGMCWLSDREVEVQGLVYASPVANAGYTYLLRRSEGKWIVVSEQQEWVS